MESREALVSYSLTSLKDETLENLSIQREMSFASVSTKKEMTERWCAPTSQRTRNTSMAMRVWWTDENSMVIGMQQTKFSLMVIGTRFMGGDLRTRTAYSHQQSSTRTQWTDANLRAASAQRTDISLRLKPYVPTHKTQGRQAADG